MKRSGVFLPTIVLFAVLSAAGCKGPKAGSGERASTAPPPPSGEAKPAPYKYPAPLKGSIHEINVGRYDLVDGLAYVAGDGAGTVVFASSKPFASPVLADSPCPMTEARSLTILRNASWAEVTVDAKGLSKYFGYGKSFGGSGFDESPGGRDWKVYRRGSAAGRIAGTAVHREDGSFQFDLPVAVPAVREVSEKNRSDGRRADPTAARPEEAAVTAAYDAVREGALSKNLKRILSAQGFGEKEIAAVRGLDGIDADLDAYADRFLQPGTPTPGEFTARSGTAYVRTEGVNGKGKKFANYYHFNSCGNRLVLVSIAENPQ
ncbi:MAG: hypothetical protein ACRD16_04595 [Thermoanaerobaculia bacterium]